MQLVKERQRSRMTGVETRRRLNRSLDRLRGTRFGRLGVKITVTLLGALVIAIGISMLVLPGPGWLVIFAGIAIWSIEFHWARRLHAFVHRQVSYWTRWYARQGWPLRVVVGLLTIVFLLAVVAVSARVSFGPGVFHRVGL